MMLLRVLKLLDFQPRTGIMTRTLAKAALYLFDFFVVFGFVLVSFAMIGHLSLGEEIEGFSTSPKAILTCLNVLLGDVDVRSDFDSLEDGKRQGAEFFFWIYIVLAFFLLINVLLAILVDAYVDVKDAAGKTHGMLEDLQELFLDLFFRIKRDAFRILRTEKDTHFSHRDYVHALMPSVHAFAATKLQALHRGKSCRKCSSNKLSFKDKHQLAASKVGLTKFIDNHYTWDKVIPVKKNKKLKAHNKNDLAHGLAAKTND